jgi:multidrug efflux pump subunit AcrA (membrane-fusion protein)
VFVVNDDKAHVRTVHVQALLGDRVVISGGVAPGDRVILTNLDVLYEGAPVRCGEENAASMRGRSAGGAEDDG